MSAQRQQDCAAKPQVDRVMGIDKDRRYEEDLALVARCLAGEETAANQLLTQHKCVLKAMLMQRGASESVADDFLEDLWGDCLGVEPDASGLLAKYSGKSSLRTWLARVVTNRWLDRIRSRREVEETESGGIEDGLSSTDPAPVEAGLAGLVRQALQRAFAQCDPESFVLLQLVHVQGISQRELAAVWGISESRLCRRLSKAMRQIRTDTLNYIKERDRHLRLNWEDLTEVCGDVTPGGS